MDNAPIISENYGDFTVEGYSRAAVQTYWRINEMHLGFDLGAHPWDFMGVPNWFISHTHLDHIAALPVYLARRRMMKMEPPTVYVPEVAMDSVKQMLGSFQKLDRGRLPCRMRGVVDGDTFEISRELVVTVHQMTHTIPCFGYIVWERRKKLKPEYQGLSSDQIRDIRLGGEEVSAEVRIPRVAYTGDTSPAGLDNNPDFFRAQVLITELTFVAQEHRPELIHKNGHMHLNDYVKRKDRFENEVIIFGHLSTRYHDNQIMHHIERKFPDMLDGRLRVWI